MMKLKELFAAIALAIRAKEGTTESIHAEDFAERIEGIKTYEDELIGIVEGTITEISNDNVKQVGEYVFYNNKKITKVNFPKADRIGEYAFGGCTSLSDITATGSVSNYAFYRCSKLEKISVYGSSVGSYAFSYCTTLKSVYFRLASQISSYAFQQCSKLNMLVLRRWTTACTLQSTNAFTGTPIAQGTGYIYVPQALIDTYKTATNWVTYANQIRAIEDYMDEIKEIFPDFE